MKRYTVTCDPRNAILAARTIIHGEKMPGKDAILVFGKGEDEVVFFVKRVKSGLSVRQCPK